MCLVKVSGAEVDLGALPLPAPLSASWVLALAIVLRYCQVAINVERQYSYLHTLEEKISQELGDEEVYRREGRAYASDYPLFSDWAWVTYVFLFSLAAPLATAVLQVHEWAGSTYPLAYKIFDLEMALGIAVSLYLYRVHPRLVGRESRTE